jgi:hypothetical protein
MKKTGIILSILVGLLLVVLIVTALLPRIVSSDLMKPYVMQMVNQQIPGKLQVKAWSLSWFGNIAGQEIVYDNRREDLLRHLNFSGSIHVDSVKAYGLILAPQDVPIRLVNASADAKLESPANGGRLAMQPIVDMRKEPYVLLFKEIIDPHFRTQPAI